MRKVFKFKNKALSADGFHGDKSPLNDRKRLMRIPLNDKAYGSEELKACISQRGRSMVEMLGVLAVIGVLSIGGIYGYRQAWVQHKANQIWNDVMLQAQYFRGIPQYNARPELGGTYISLFDGRVGSAGYRTFGMLRYDGTRSTGVFQLWVENVPEEICQKVIEMRPEEPVGVLGNKKGAGNYSVGCGAGKNKMSFIFDFPAPCVNIYEGFYKQWQEECGTEWAWCDKSLGIYTEAWYSDDLCNGAGGWFCSFFRYNKNEEQWDTRQFNLACP